TTDSRRGRLQSSRQPPWSGFEGNHPQEYVNQDVKTNVIGKKRPINKVQMRANVEEFMYNTKITKSRCKNIFM
ncbi:MAG: hypothetical protein ACK5VK_08130, partial [Cyclobacteriaceae bacterium]